MSKKTLPKRTRLNVRVQTDLLTWAKKYAMKKNTSVTQIIIDHFTQLRTTGST